MVTNTESETDPTTIVNGSSNSSPTECPTSASALSSGAIAAIVMAVIVFVLIIVILPLLMIMLIYIWGLRAQRKDLKKQVDSLEMRMQEQEGQAVFNQLPYKN